MKILIVDDERLILMGLKAVIGKIEDLSCEVQTAMSGEQAAGGHAPTPLGTPERFAKIREHIKRTGETPEEFVDRAIEDTMARDVVSLKIGINPAGK